MSDLTPQFVLKWIKDGWTHEAQRAVRQLFDLATCMSVSHVCALTNFLLITNALDPEHFGNYSVWLTMHSFLLTILPMGTTLAIIQEGASASASRNELWSSQLTIVGAMTLLSVATASAVAPFSGISGVGLAILAGVLLAAIAGSLSPFPFFDIDRRQSYSAGIVTLIDVLSLLATSVAYFLDALSLPLLTCFLGAKQILITTCQHAYYRMFVRKLAWAPSGSVLKRLTRLSWPIMVSSFLVQVPIQGGLLQVKWFRGAEEAGTFAVAAQALLACIMLGSIAVRVLHPHIAGPMGWHPTFVKKLVAFLIIAVGGMGLMVYSIFFYLIFYQMPAEYAFAGELLGPLVLSAIFIIAHSFADLYLLTRMRAGIMLVIHAVKAAAYVAITSLAAVLFGSYGVAVGGLSACGIGLVGVGVVLMRIKRVN